MADFGSDILTTPDGDIDPFFRLSSGVPVLAWAIVRRLSTAVLWYAAGYGYDLTAIVNQGFSDVDLMALKSQIETQCQLDDRVQGATASINLNTQTKSMTIGIQIATANGPFQMIVGVDALNVSLIGTAA